MTVSSKIIKGGREYATIDKKRDGGGFNYTRLLGDH